jgi:hypothetical protein
MKETGNFMPEANLGPEVQPTMPEMITLNQEGIVVVEPPQKPGFFKRVIRRGIPAAAGLALVFAACSGGDQNNDIRIDTQTPTPTAGAVLEPTPTPRTTPTLSPSNGGGSDGKFPTPEPTRTATATPEVEAPTKVFPTVNDQGERVLYKNENTTFVCFNFDSKQPIYAPVSGNFSANLKENKPFAGVGISVYRADGAFQVTGNIEIRKDIGSSVQAGDLLGYTNVGVSDKKSLGCDVVVTFLKRSATGNGTETDIDAIANVFPGSISKPIREFTSQVEHKSGSGVVFLGPNPQ